MRIIELKQEIDAKTELSASLRKQLSNLQKDITDLQTQYRDLEMAEFVEYLQIGEVIEFDNYYSFSGYCKDPKSTNSFTSGERIKIVKKNKKSIVVEVIKKLQRRWDASQNKSVLIGEINPGWNIRVELDSFFHFYLKSPAMKMAFESYIKRKNALNNLFDE